MILPLALFAQLAASCGPTVHVDTLAAIARTESRFNALAIGDNATGRSGAPATRAEAVAIASALLAKGHSLDLGLMQINSTTLDRLGLTVADAFDPCTSIAAGARVLVDGYRPAPGDDGQRALLRALSHYNTGSPVRGLANGYVAKVQASAEQVVPALRVGGQRATDADVPSAQAPAAALPPRPPSWDVYARARYARQHGGLLANTARPAPAAAPEPQSRPSLAAPVPLQPAPRGALPAAAADTPRRNHPQP